MSNEAIWQFNEAVSYLSEIERVGLTPALKADLTRDLPTIREALITAANARFSGESE